MAEDGTNTAESAAGTMLEAFASVGATRFEITWTDIDGVKQAYRRRSLGELARLMPEILDRATAQQRNVIIRPEGPRVSFIQLDDLTGDKLAAVAPAQFLTIETSPGSFQAWIAITDDHSKEFARRVRKAAAADLNASGATRIAGSLNFKPKYAPDFPRVKIHAMQPGRIVTAAELDDCGLVAPKEEFAALPPALSASPYRWPSYADTLAGAPLNRDGTGPDRSKADFVFCMTCISWGFGIEETAARLLQESTRAQEARHGKSYAEATARNAAAAVERRQTPQRRPITAHERR